MQRPGIAVRMAPGHAGVDLRADLHLGDGQRLHAGARGFAAGHDQLAHALRDQAFCDGRERLLDALARVGRKDRVALLAAVAETRPIDVDDAIAEVAKHFVELRERHGDDAVAFYVSGQMSLEAQYLSNKLCKGYFRTNLIESNSRLCMASAGTGYKQSLGADGPPGSYEDLDHADVFLVTGANMADCHPILFLRMMDRVKEGAKLIVVDPRRTATAAKADLYLPVRPGTDMALLNGLLKLIVDAGQIDEEFIAEHTNGWDVMTDHLADYTADRVAAITGVDEVRDGGVPLDFDADYASYAALAAATVPAAVTSVTRSQPMVCWASGAPAKRMGRRTTRRSPGAVRR